MSTHRSSRIGALSGGALVAFLTTACADPSMPSEMSHQPVSPQFNYNAAAGADKGYIAGWLDGEDVSLHYTKSFFCEEPPESGAASGCVIGADAEVYPRRARSPQSTPSRRSAFSPMWRHSPARPAAHA